MRAALFSPKYMPNLGREAPQRPHGAPPRTFTLLIAPITLKFVSLTILPHCTHLATFQLGTPILPFALAPPPPLTPHPHLLPKALHYASQDSFSQHCTAPMRLCNHFPNTNYRSTHNLTFQESSKILFYSVRLRRLESGNKLKGSRNNARQLLAKYLSRNKPKPLNLLIW